MPRAIGGGSNVPGGGAAELTGHWYLNRDGARLTLTVPSGNGSSPLAGTSALEGSDAPSAAADQFSFDGPGSRLTFCAHEADADVWYSLRLQDGVVAGRYASVAIGAGQPTGAVAYRGRVTGWRDETFSDDIVPRAWDIVIDATTSAVLRIDRTAPDAAEFVGRLKLYGTGGQLDEQLAEDVDVESWDGQTLSFVRRASAAQERFTGKAGGRTITGTLSPTTGPTAGTATAWNGHRIEVLSHGLGARSASTFSDWQARTRGRLGLVAMGGNPAPVTFRVTELGTKDPIPDSAWASRDDDSDQFPQSYKLTELSFDSTLPDPAGGAPLTRKAHGYLSVPTTPPPPDGYPVVLALNGHGGSALDVFNPAWLFWYGDAFARRGYVVISVDIGHRPLEDRAAVYPDQVDGDDFATGNGTHPAVKATGMSTDWEEDPERAWDAMRALDHVLARDDVNASNVVLAGLSMGGEVSDWVAAMDVRVGTTFSAGSASDLAVMSLHWNHPCWRWQRADPREYFDVGDLTAMAAPRVMVRETGAQDYTYSDIASPFSSAKEVVRRAKPAFDALGGQLLHYLHFDAHAFHVGDFCPAVDAARGVTIPMEASPDPTSLWSTAWDADGRLTPMASSIFDLLPGT